MNDLDAIRARVAAHSGTEAQISVRHDRAALLQYVDELLVEGAAMKRDAELRMVRHANREQAEELTKLRSRLAEATEIIREARDDVAEILGQQSKRHRIAAYTADLARIDAFLGAAEEKP